MIHATSNVRAESASPWPILLATGVLVGTLDILFAIAFWAARGATPTGVLQAIAAGVLGAASYRHGLASALLGATLHYFIATCMVIAYYLVSRHWRVLTVYPIRFGMAYGVWLFVLMTYIMVPLSIAPPLSGEGPGWRWTFPTSSCTCCWSACRARSRRGQRWPTGNKRRAESPPAIPPNVLSHPSRTGTRNDHSFALKRACSRAGLRPARSLVGA